MQLVAKAMINTGADPGGGRQARLPPSSAKKKKKKKRRERERKEKKKKRGKRKRDIKKLRCHNLFFCAYIGLHWPGGQGAPVPINEGEI